MKEEIKEILDRLFVYKNENDEMKYQPEDILTIDDVWLLLDYITKLQEENEDLREENKEAHDFDETMKDIKDNLIARINRQECEIHNLKEENKELEEDKSKMFETAVKRNNQLLDRINKAIEYLGINEEILETCEIYDVNGIEVYKILQGNKWNEVERAYLDDKPIGGDKE